MNLQQLPIFLLLLLFSSLGFADVYKWTDDRGITHYTQYKPLKYKSELVDAPPPPPSYAPDLNKPYAQQIEKSGQSLRQQQAASKSSSSKNDFNAQQCATAKKNLNALRSEGRISFVDSSGQKVFMDDAEKQSRIQEAQKQIEFYCE